MTKKKKENKHYSPTESTLRFGLCYLHELIVGCQYHHGASYFFLQVQEELALLY